MFFTSSKSSAPRGASENEDQAEFHTLLQSVPPWYKNTRLVKLYFLLLAPILTTTALGFDLSMTSGLQSVTRFMDKMGHPTGSALGFFGASMSVGGLVSCIVGGPLTDRFGRKILCSVGAVITVGAALMQTFAINLGMFAGGKVLVGFGVGLQQLAAPVLVTELAHPNNRVFVTAFYNTNIIVGFIIGGWTTFGTYSIQSDWAWKLPCLLQVILPAYQAVMVWFCPESPRWLVKTGRYEQARAILIHYHSSLPGIEDAVVRAEMQEIMAGVEADKTQIRFNKEGLKTVFGSRGNLHRLWICFWTAIGSQCTGNHFITSYLPVILDQIGMTSEYEKTLMNGVTSIFQWVAAVLALFVIDRMKRRTLFLFATSGMTLSFAVWTGLAARYLQTGHKSYGSGVLAMIFFFSFFNSICWNPLCVAYPLELLTTKQRAVFFAWTMFSINISSFLSQYINPIGIGSLSWRFYLVQIAFNCLLIAIIYFTYVETHGYTLEEVAVIFDGAESFNAAKVAAKETLNEIDGKADLMATEVEVANKTA